MPDKLTDEEKTLLQTQADDPRSPINRDPIERANVMIREKVIGVELRKWCVERSCDVVTHQHSLPDPIGATTKLAIELYGFVADGYVGPRNVTSIKSV